MIKISKEELMGGLADGKPDSKYNKKELGKGVKVEREHTKDPKKAKEIAKDHLEEYPDYYTRLYKMENECEGSKKMKSVAKKDKKKGRCWKGYEPVPGKEPYSEDSCKKKSKKAMGLSTVIKAHLSGEQSEQSNAVFAKISNKLQEAGYKTPFRVVAIDESIERIKYDKKKNMNRVKEMTDAAIEYNLKDLNEVIEAQEEGRRAGLPVEKLGYYMDERHHLLEEKMRRMQEGTWFGGIGDFDQDEFKNLSKI